MKCSTTGFRERKHGREELRCFQLKQKVHKWRKKGGTRMVKSKTGQQMGKKKKKKEKGERKSDRNMK